MNKLLILIVFFSFAKTQDFNQGPYGINYFDTAGPFEVNDLNLNVGDVDLNQTVDILDLFLAIDFILGNLSLDIEQETQSDCNLDNIIDIADIINISKIILGGDALWNFEYQWNGEETYIFITIGIPTSLSLWYSTSLESLLFGPTSLTNGTENLIGALKTSMGTLGAQNLKEMQQVEVVVAPSLLTEGKVYQKAQQLGMGK